MKQKIGGYVVDMVSGDELGQHLHDSFTQHLIELYRGISYPAFTGLGAGTGNVSIPGPASGYAWSIRTISLQASAATPVSVYAGENTNNSPVGVGATQANGTANECVIQWADEAWVLADERVITVVTGTANILNWRISVKQVPAEMVGKL